MGERKGARWEKAKDMAGCCCISQIARALPYLSLSAFGRNFYALRPTAWAEKTFQEFSHPSFSVSISRSIISSTWDP